MQIYDEQYEVRLATEADLLELLTLEQVCFADAWTEGMLLDEIQSPLSSLYVAVDSSEQIVGYAGFWLVCQEAQITNVAIAPEHRQRGLGLMLLSELIVEARKKEARMYTLEVRLSNIAAQALYKRAGFDPVGTRPKYYSDGEDAIIMSKFES